MKRAIRNVLIFIYQRGLRLFGGLGFHKIWPLGIMRDWLSDAVRNFERPQSIVFRGHTMFLDPEDNQELSVWGDKHWSNDEVAVAEESAGEGDTVVDVGANIGLFTLVLARAVGSGGRVFAFEPGPANVALLERNVAANGYKNVTVVPNAVAESSGRLTLFLSDYNPGDHRIYDPGERLRDWEKSSAVYEKLVNEKEGRKTVEVNATALDDFLKDMPPIKFMKIDVQGAEGGVIRGALKTLRRSPDVKILAEFWPAGLKMFGIDAGEYLTTLSDLGFSFFDVDKGKQPQPMNREELLKKYTVRNNLSGNLFCVRIK